MKVLSLHQPWASLVSLGVKTIETRSWSTKYRGPLAIHAAARVPEHGSKVGEYAVWVPCLAKCYVDRVTINGPISQTVPLGAIVATCELVDVVPIVGWDRKRDHPDAPSVDRCVAIEPGEPGGPFVRVWAYCVLDQQPKIGVWVGDIAPDTDQRPYGDFTPGRFAWLLDKIEPLAEPVPFKGGQALSRSWEP